MKTRIRMAILATVAMITTTGIQAQVVVGADKAPETFSMVEIVSNGQGGLRLPQLTNAQKTILVATQAFINEQYDQAKGLIFFNVDDQCIEVWNGDTWIRVFAE